MTRKAIVVVGMHRSGTSALTRVLNLLGVDLPRAVQGPGPGNALGHWEPSAAVALHRRMLLDAGSATNSPVDFDSAWFDGPSAAAFVERIAALIEAEYGSSPLFVMKEPRASLFLPLWIRALERLEIEPHFVMSFRHPDAVARSLRTRQLSVFPQAIWPAARAIALWLRYGLAAERATRAHRRSFIAFDALLADWRAELARVGRHLAIAWPRDATGADIDRFLDSRHRHHAATDDAVPPVAAAVFAAFRDAVEAPHAGTDVFDRAAAALAPGETLLAPYLARLEERVEAPPGRAIVFLAGSPPPPYLDHYAAAARRLGHRVTMATSDEAPAAVDGADLLVIGRCAWSEAVERIIRRAQGGGAKIIALVDDCCGIDENIIASADLCAAVSPGLLPRLRDLARPLVRLPDGFDEAALMAGQMAAERRRRSRDGVRIGCVGAFGDLAARLEDEYPDVVLVGQLDGVDIVAVPPAACRRMTEASREALTLQAALARLPIVAAPVGFFAAEIIPGVTGLLADEDEDWLAQVGALIEDRQSRQTIGENALHHVLWYFGPEGRVRRLATLLDYLFAGGREAASAFRTHIEDLKRPAFVRPATPDYDIVLDGERRAPSPVAVIIPLYNYAHHVEEALESVKAQTLDAIDLVVVDDCSTDQSLAVARAWIERNRERFNHAALLRNRVQATLGPTRNAAFSFASAPRIMTLDADNILLPGCLEHCLAALDASDAAAAYPILKQFGESDALLGDHAWQPARLACSNTIDAMAMIRKAAWATVGGYALLPSRHDYELWMKFIERGFWAVQVPIVLARYRVHATSMVRRYTMDKMIADRFWPTLADAHPWIAVPPWSLADEG